MNNKRDYIWYVAYGSNLSEERFLCYIKGGKTATCLRVSKGCTDPSLPIENRPAIIPHQLYFAKEGTVWGKGAASFIEPSPSEAESYVRQYLIRPDQFKDIVIQENDENIENIVIDFEEAIEKGQTLVGEGENFDWYGRVVYLGEDEGIPRFTFTAKWEDELIDYNRPSERYLKTIIRGLKETHKLSEEDIRNYLKKLPGIKGHMTDEELDDLLK